MHCVNQRWARVQLDGGGVVLEIFKVGVKVIFTVGGWWGVKKFQLFFFLFTKFW